MKKTFLLILLGLLVPISLYGKEDAPKVFSEVGVTEKVGQAIPKTLLVINESGQEGPLSDYLDPSKPTILSLVYYNCPMLCNLILTGFTESLTKLPFEVGDRFNVISFSFDHRDTPKTASTFKATYMAQLGQDNAKNNWHFLTGSTDTINKLTDAVGFRFKFDEKTGEFAHGSALVLISPNGKISRYLYGIEFNPFNLKMAILEASNGKQISTIEQGLLYCYRYDPKANSYVIHAVTLMRIGGALTVIAIVGLIAILLIRQKKRSGNGNN